LFLHFPNVKIYEDRLPLIWFSMEDWKDRQDL